MTSLFPHRYPIKLSWTHEGSEGTLSGESKPDLFGGPPPQFGGRPENWSPEDLFTSSVALCFMTTFFSLAKRDGVPVEDYSCEAEGILDKTSEGIRFSGVTLKVNLVVSASDVDRGRSLLEKAKKYCFVSNSIKCPVALEANVNIQRVEGEK